MYTKNYIYIYWNIFLHPYSDLCYYDNSQTREPRNLRHMQGDIYIYQKWASDTRRKERRALLCFKKCTKMEST